MTDVQLNGQSITTTSATTAPASGTPETWTVTALAAGIPPLQPGQTYALVDATAGVSAPQQAEMIRVTTAATAGATSIVVTRGADNTTPVAHAPVAVFSIIIAASAMEAKTEGVLAAAVNSTNTPTAIAGFGVYALIPSTGIVVPASAKSVWFEWSAFVQVTTANPGGAYISVQETTSGTATQLCYASKPITAANSGTYSTILGEVAGRWLLGPTTAVRTFSLYGVQLYDSAACAWSVLNAPVSPSYLRAVV